MSKNLNYVTIAEKKTIFIESCLEYLFVKDREVLLAVCKLALLTLRQRLNESKEQKLS